MVLVNFLIQGTLLVYLARTVRDDVSAGYTPTSSPVLRVTCFSLFSAFTMKEMLQTYTMAQWLRMVKTSEKHEEITIGKDEKGRCVLKSGMRSGSKLRNAVFILLPKFGISVALYVVGIAFISLAENDKDVLLNTLAVYFITDVDEYMFATFTPVFIRDAVSKIPPLRIADSDLALQQTLAGLFYTNLLAMAAVGTAAVMCEWATTTFVVPYPL